MSADKDNPEHYLTVREVATQLRVDPETVRKWVRAGALEAVRIAPRGSERGRIRIRRADAARLLR